MRGSHVLRSSATTPEYFIRLMRNFSTRTSCQLRRSSVASVLLPWPLSLARRRSFASATELPSSLQSTSATKKEKAAANRILIQATKEADRVLHLCRNENVSVDATRAAADTLLQITEPFLLWNGNFLDQIGASRQQYMAFHQAFLQVLQGLLGQIQRRAAEVDPQLLQSTLQLSRRVFGLDLSLHVPLYQKLMEAFCRHGQILEKERPPRLVLEVVSWMASRHPPKGMTQPPASWWLPSLLHFVETRRLESAMELLLFLRTEHGVDRIDVATARDILQVLYPVVQEHVASDSNESGHGVEGVITTLTEDIQELSMFLESSLQYIFEDATALMEQFSILQEMDMAADDQQQYPPSSVLQHIVDELRHRDGPADESDDGFPTSPRSLPSMLSDGAITCPARSLILSGAQGRSVRALLSGLLQQVAPPSKLPETSSSDPNDNPPALPQLALLASLHNPETEQVFEAYIIESPSRHDDGYDSDHTAIPDMSYLYVHSPDFPDVTRQLQSLVNVRYAHEYERVLWMREYQEWQDDDDWLNGTIQLEDEDEGSSDDDDS